MADKVRDDLEKRGYTYIPNLVAPETANFIVEEAKRLCREESSSQILQLNDSDDKENHLYKSQRSKMNYCFLRSEDILKINQEVAQKLSSLTGISWGNNIDRVALPVFEYGLGGFIKEHRDRDIGYGPNNYICTVLLTKPGIDFNNGKFFLNEHAEVSNNGKEVFSEDKTKRIYIDQDIGSGILFFNPRFIHGTLPIAEGVDGRATRLTASLRSP